MPASEAISFMFRKWSTGMPAARRRCRTPSPEGTAPSGGGEKSPPRRNSESLPAKAAAPPPTLTASRGEKAVSRPILEVIIPAREEAPSKGTPSSAAASSRIFRPSSGRSSPISPRPPRVYQSAFRERKPPCRRTEAITGQGMEGLLAPQVEAPREWIHRTSAPRCSAAARIE